MLVDKDDKGFGYRSWRYAMIVDNGVVNNFFEEPGLQTIDCETHMVSLHQRMCYSG